MFAPAFTLELLTPTSAFTPTFGFTLVVFELELPEGCDVLEVSELDDGLVEVVPLVEDELLFALMSVELEEELEEELGLDVVPLPFKSRLEELEELEGVEVPLSTLRLVELDELLGADALPLRLMSVELDDAPGTAPLTVVEDELDPGTTAMPGVVMSDVVVLDWLSGTLGTHPAGVVFAVSMHFGSSGPFVTLVMVSARAAPKAANSEAARRLVLKVFRFIALPPFWARFGCGIPPVEGLRPMVHAGPWQVVHAPSGVLQADHFVGARLQMQSDRSDISVGDSCRISLSTP